MKGLYLLLDGLTLFFPLVLSFDRRVNYVSKWKSVLYATLIIAVPFLIWDFIFTEHGFWGFNTDYLVGIDIGNLPLEEVLFFIVVPFACTFIYECVKYYFRKLRFQLLDRILYFALPIYAMVLTLLEPTGWYTLSVVISSGVVLFFWLRDPRYKFVGISFLISLIPFLIVNGILTGGVTEEPIVWYSELQKVTPRIWTIPVEDVLYCFTLIVSVFLLTEFFEKRKSI
ncbi:MAG: lycopene cyclase domain-containing protein [Crocinitomicaceae bacterium]|nr:lycopene cyclase domain-containing protein [Crocinitomicaceae bacterium]